MKACWGILLALLSATALAVDVTVQWDAHNPAEPVTSTEIRWQNPTDWSPTQTLGADVTSHVVQNIQPGVFAAEVRFCTNDPEYATPCSAWAGGDSRAPSQPTQPILVGDQ